MLEDQTGNTQGNDYGYVLNSQVFAKIINT